MTLTWIKSENLTQVPAAAISAGVNENDENVYVGRARHNDTWVVVTIAPTRQMACGQTSDGINFETTEAEFLVGSEYGWTLTFAYGEMPANVVTTAHNLCIGRFCLEDHTFLVGEIHTNDGYIYCWGNPPRAEYQFLCFKSSEVMEVHSEDDDIWKEVRPNDPIPADAILGGIDNENHPLYVARIRHHGDLLPGMVVGSNTNPVLVEKISAPWGCTENESEVGMILTGKGYTWQAGDSGNVPDGALEAGATVDYETLYVGRANFMGNTVPGKVHPSHRLLYIGWEGRELNFGEYEVLVAGEIHHDYEWRRCAQEEQIPADVVRAEPGLAVGRVSKGDAIAVVSILPSKKPMKAKFGLSIEEHSDFEYLCGSEFSWSKVYKNGSIPKDAMPAGRTQNGDMAYIGRLPHEKGTAYIGEISPSDGGMFLVLEPKLVSFFDYEVLQHPSARGRQAIDRIRVEDTTALGYSWMDCKKGDLLPEHAVLVGCELDTDYDCYVGRFWRDGNVLPASVSVDENQVIIRCSVALTHGEEGSILFQVLVGIDFGWRSCKNRIPAGAMTSGKIGNGDDVVIGRTLCHNQLVSCRMQRLNGRPVIRHDGGTLDLRDIEVLMPRPVDGDQDDAVRWVASSIEKSLPNNAVFVGLDAYGSEIYAGRMFYDFKMLPTNIIPKRRLAVSSLDGTEITLQSYEVLVGTGFAWIDCINGQVPEDAVKLKSNDGQEDTFIGRVQSNKSLKLGRVSPAHRCLFVPDENDEHRYSHYQALVKLMKGVQDMEGYRWIAIDGIHNTWEPLNVVPCKAGAGSTWVGRLFHEGDFLPAEVSTNFKIAVAVYKNSVITSTKFEVLSGTSFSWEQSSDGGIPSGAIVSGKTLYGEWLFIGRVHDNNHLRIGKVHPSHGRIYVPHNSKTKTFTTYEVLVQQKLTPPVVPMAEGETSGKCCVCWENEATMAVIPCGNLCLCNQCCQNPMLDRCPVCRGPKLHCIRIFKT